MKKTLSLILALMLMLSCFGAFAEGESTESTGDSAGTTVSAEEEAANAAAIAALEARCEYALIPADETTGQIQLTYMPETTTILEVDGLKFKDLNKNGELDVYEDWRKPVEDRVADVYSQMTVEEKAGLLFCTNTPDGPSAITLVEKWNLTCQLFNSNGTPITITNTLNNLQAVAEGLRLGVPMVFTSDREYNSFGGYIDKSHNAFGNANDPELAYQLASYYGKAMDAIGIHVTFEPYANEIGAQYGENPELIASIISAEIRGLQENGLSSCTKHWIGRGGDASFSAARSVAQNFDNWMVGWKAALDAGCDWIMTNCGDTGITNSVDVKLDPVTMGYLRDTLGFDGVIVTDWWPIGGGPKNSGRLTGITPDGHDLATKDIYWLYNRILELGTDILGSGGMQDSHENWESMPMSNYPTAMIQGIKDGTIEEKNVQRAAYSVLTYKFEKGLFDDPYNDVDYAVEVCASVEWAANPVAPTSNEELRAARNPEEVALTEQLMAKSAVLLKNDNNLLPLQQGIKVYIDASATAAKNGYKTYIAQYATVVEDMEEADVMVGDFGSINDACELFLDDAAYYGKPVVLTLNGTNPTQYALENADAVMYLPYNQSADHGSTEAGFVNTTAAWVYADLIFGIVEPGGIITKEIARDSALDAVQWKDLAGDQGADPYVRLIIQALMEDDPMHASPSNYGDPLVTYQYGMSYGKNPEFKYSCLILPQVVTVEEVQSGSSTTTQTTLKNQIKAGESFTVYCLLRNNGADGITVVEAYANDVLVAEKIMTVEGGSWRVVQMDLTLEAGDYTIKVGDQVGTLTVTE
ncbi:MAG: glycoside hydrolase family 3 protein [Clostridia bacterium]|nr:glycoside hydrolase family 3 protein [Clostridia bacterium]